MKKMRIYEYAKENNMKSKDVIQYLKQIDIEVSNHMSTITENAIRQLDNLIKGKDNNVQTDNKQTESKQTDKKVRQQEKPKEKKETVPQKKEEKKQVESKEVKQNENKNKQKTSRNNQTKNKSKSKPASKQRGKSQNKRPVKEQQTAKTPDKITFEGTLTVGELAQKLNKEASEIIKQLMILGVVATINESLDKDSIELICSEYNVEVEEIIPVDLADLSHYIEVDQEDYLIERPAVVTIMGD